MLILEEIRQAMVKGRLPKVKELAAAALEEGITAETILKEALLAGMEEVGEAFKNNRVFIPEVMMASRTMKAAVELIKPHFKGEIRKKGTVVIGTVKGDQHDIGKNLVKIMMEGAGLDVIDLGTNVPPERFIERAVESGARVVAASALLTTTMVHMRELVELRDRGYPDLKIMVGGAPVTEEFKEKIGADFYGPDAACAAQYAASLY